MIYIRKIFLAVCFLSIAGGCFGGDPVKRFFGPNEEIPQEIRGLPDSRRSEKIHQEDDLFLVMQQTFTQLKKDYQKMIIEVNDLVKNGQPEKRMGKWYLEEKADFYQINILCSQKPEHFPVAASKRYFYKEMPSGQKTEAFSFNLYFNDKYVSFKTSDGTGLLFYQGILEGYYFKLNENRTYEAHFDDEGKFKRAVIIKPRRPKEEKEPEYELYFSEQNDLDIIKNKLLNRLIKQSYIARTKEVNEAEDISNRSVSKIDYDITFGKDVTISRFFRKSTGEEISFHSNGRVKSFSLPITANKRFTAEWAEQGQLIRNKTITPTP